MTSTVSTAPSPEPQASPAPVWHSPLGMTLAALVLGLSVELLFDRRPLGVSFAIWAFLCVVVLLVVAARERIRTSWDGWWLVAPILFFSAMVFVRLEPMTVLLDFGLTLALFALWIRVFRSGRLARFGWLDFGLALAWVPLEACFRPWRVLSEAWNLAAGERGRRSRLAPILRGLLLALPVVIIFAALLSAADLVFSDYLTAVLHWLRLDQIAELLGRAAIVIVSGIFLLGASAVALRTTGERRLIGEEKPLLSPFVGFTESVVLLGAVDLLFSAFVAVQFAYLFGGQANITAAGYTYSDYARRGFGELVAVSVLTLGMILALGYLSKREGRWPIAWFNGLSGLLVGLVGVILASAMMRLLMYESAYGFTRLRTYTHVAILWMAALFVAFLGLLIAGRLRPFALATVIGILGFGVTLNLLNVDAFITRQNASRLAASGEVDVAYLASLSYDAAPALVQMAAAAPAEVRSELLPELACWQAQMLDRGQRVGWPSHHLSYVSALRSLAPLQDELSGYPVEWQPYDESYPEWGGNWVVTVGAKEQPCSTGWAD